MPTAAWGGAEVGELARISLDGGGSILVEADSGGGSGPVKAGRLGGVIHDMPTDMSTVLQPVVGMARTILGHLREAGPGEIQVEFGVDLSVQAGVVITKVETAGHLKVTLTWNREHGDSASTGSAG